MSTYTNTHTNHTDDVSKKWPIVIPWNSSVWDGSLNFIGTKISSADLRELRQHAKALEANFNFVATNPSYIKVSDAETNQGEFIESEHLNQIPGVLTAAGAGLLDGIKTIKPTTTVGAVPDGDIMTKAKLQEIAVEINNLKTYANYSNQNTTGYGQYSNYVIYSRGTGLYTRANSSYNYWGYSDANVYSEYNRSIHGDNDADPAKYNRGIGSYPIYVYNNSGTYSDANYYSNESTPGYVNGTYNNSTVVYSNAVYSNAYTNPATYQNNL